MLYGCRGPRFQAAKTCRAAAPVATRGRSGRARPLTGGKLPLPSTTEGRQIFSATWESFAPSAMHAVSLAAPATDPVCLTISAVLYLSTAFAQSWPAGGAGTAMVENGNGR